jgi:hypothetical protein
MYVLLCGKLPFDDDHIPSLFKKIESELEEAVSPSSAHSLQVAAITFLHMSPRAHDIFSNGCSTLIL